MKSRILTPLILALAIALALPAPALAGVSNRTPLRCLLRRLPP